MIVNYNNGSKACNFENMEVGYLADAIREYKEGEAKVDLWIKNIMDKKVSLLNEKYENIKIHNKHADTDKGCGFYIKYSVSYWSKTINLDFIAYIKKINTTGLTDAEKKKAKEYNDLDFIDKCKFSCWELSGMKHGVYANERLIYTFELEDLLKDDFYKKGLQLKTEHFTIIK